LAHVETPIIFKLHGIWVPPYFQTPRVAKRIHAKEGTTLKAPPAFGGKEVWRGSPTPDNLGRAISFGNPIWGWHFSKCPGDGDFSSFHHING